MSAFAQALAALNLDQNLSAPCTWHPAWLRPAARTFRADLQAETYTLSTEGLALRGVRAQGQGSVFSIAGSGTSAPREMLDIAMADVTAGIQRGDLLAVDGATFVVEQADTDTEGVTWRITLSDAA